MLANGNIYSAAKADEVLALTGARGLMIGRGVIRNPWLFRQIRESPQRRCRSSARPGATSSPTCTRSTKPSARPRSANSRRCNNMKKYLNFIGLGVEPTGEFLHRIRRVTSRADFFAVCAEYLDHDDPMPLEPFTIPLEPRDVMAGATR